MVSGLVSIRRPKHASLGSPTQVRPLRLADPSSKVRHLWLADPRTPAVARRPKYAGCGSLTQVRQLWLADPSTPAVARRPKYAGCGSPAQREVHIAQLFPQCSVVTNMLNFADLAQLCPLCSALLLALKLRFVV